VANADTVDITDLVEKTRSAFVDWAVAYVYGVEVAIPELGPIIELPVIKEADQEIIRLVVDSLSKSAIMLAFFTNTVLRKATQADDFVKAVNAKFNLPGDASNDDIQKAEAAQMVAFRNFVVLVN
jgi:hypothetical protein